MNKLFFIQFFFLVFLVACGPDEAGLSVSQRKAALPAPIFDVEYSPTSRVTKGEAERRGTFFRLEGQKNSVLFSSVLLSPVLRDGILPSTSSGIPPEGVRLGYTYKTERQNRHGLSADTVTIGCYAREKTTELQFYLQTGSSALYLYPGLCGFVPQGLYARSFPEGFSVDDLTPVDFSSGEDTETPLPIELGGILTYERDNWRREEFELFSWDRYPSVLIMDIADYSLQADFFKRLAFFVEKEGFIGKILPNSFLEGRHGWNAHDYRAVDVAYFFQKTRDGRFPLNKEEEILKRILLTNRVIREEDGSFVPGKGAIISISRESRPYLRKKFLIHEAYHGLFFVNQEYEEECFSLWNGLRPVDRELWKNIFSWMGYNTDDRYLMVNEFQAYLLQQPLGEVEDYFRSHPAMDYVLTRSSDRVKYREILQQDNNYYTRMAEDVSNAVAKTAGFSPEKLLGIPKESLR